MGTTASATHPWHAITAAAAPIAVVDLDAFDANAATLESLAGDLPIRLATKSVRVPALVDRTLSRPRWTGVLAYSAAEAIDLAKSGAADVLVGYPTVDAEAIAEVCDDDRLRDAITFMIDSPEHITLLAGIGARGCIDVDCALRLGSVRLGAHRSGVSTPEQAARLAELARDNGIGLVGLMFYEAQVAGVPDNRRGIGWVKRASMKQLNAQRSAFVAAVARHAELEFVNGGGTGSLHRTRTDPAVTELSAGSGLLAPHSFDHYDGVRLTPAAWFACPVVRKPRADIAVVFAGGYTASGQPGASRLPVPVHPSGLRYFRSESAGEVQTPVHGPAARSLAVGDLVWFRHTKAGELFERFDSVTLVSNGQVTGDVATYRGAGRNYG